MRGTYVGPLILMEGQIQLCEEGRWEESPDNQLELAKRRE